MAGFIYHAEKPYKYKNNYADFTLQISLTIPNNGYVVCTFKIIAYKNDNDEILDIIYSDL